MLGWALIFEPDAEALDNTDSSSLSIHSNVYLKFRIDIKTEEAIDRYNDRLLFEMKSLKKRKQKTHY